MMKKIVLLVTTFALLTGHLFANDHIDSLFNKYESPESPGVAIMIMKEGRVLYQNCYGTANIDKETSITVNTNFNLVGITNQVTAIAVLQLTEAQKLKLSTRLGDVLDWVPTYMQGVTIGKLLLHESGIPNSYIDLKQQAVQDKDAFIQHLRKDTALVRRPGNLLISQINYILLGYVIEEISGTSYAKYVKANILAPLDMTRSFVAPGGKKLPKKSAIGYDYSNSQYSANFEYRSYKLPGEALVYSSLNDYKKLTSVFLQRGANILSEKNAQTFFALNFKPGLTRMSSYGWNMSFNSGHQYFFQYGASFGYTHCTIYLPYEKIYAVVFTNLTGFRRLQSYTFNVINQFSKVQYQLK